MTNTPTFDDLTPPHDMYVSWIERAYTELGPAINNRNLALFAYRAGARRGWEQARQLWPEPIRDRPPTERDADDKGGVQVVSVTGCWSTWHWEAAASEKRPWLHTPRWQPRQPRQPSLQEQALQVLAGFEKRCDLQCDLSLIRRALEQAGERVE